MPFLNLVASFFAASQLLCKFLIRSLCPQYSRLFIGIGFTLRGLFLNSDFSTQDNQSVSSATFAKSRLLQYLKYFLVTTTERTGNYCALGRKQVAGDRATRRKVMNSHLNGEGQPKKSRELAFKDKHTHIQCVCYNFEKFPVKIVSLIL